MKVISALCLRENVYWLSIAFKNLFLLWLWNFEILVVEGVVANKYTYVSFGIFVFFICEERTFYIRIRNFEMI